MKNFANIARQFRDEETGAAMVEYSILLGLIAAATITAVIAIGGWVTGQFAGLCDTLAANTSVACDATGGAGGGGAGG